VVRVHESRSRSGSPSARGTNPPTRCSQTRRCREDSENRPRTPQQGKPVSQRASQTAIRAIAGPHFGLTSPDLMPGDRRYFTAELLQVAHRISCPTPERNSTATKPIDRLSTLTHSFAGRSKLLSETIPVPVRPQWGQQSATAQAFNAVIMQVYLRFMTFVRRLRVGILCWAAHRICSKLHPSRGRTAVWRDFAGPPPTARGSRLHRQPSRRCP
jgi:hypothetical protein